MTERENKCDCGWTPLPGVAHCYWCHVDIKGPIDVIVDHVRLLHPDVFEDLPRWPDGGIVVLDEREPGWFA